MPDKHLSIVAILVTGLLYATEDQSIRSEKVGSTPNRPVPTTVKGARVLDLRLKFATVVRLLFDAPDDPLNPWVKIGDRLDFFPARVHTQMNSLKFNPLADYPNTSKNYDVRRKISLEMG